MVTLDYSWNDNEKSVESLSFPDVNDKNIEKTTRSGIFQSEQFNFYFLYSLLYLIELYSWFYNIAYIDIIILIWFV